MSKRTLLIWACAGLVTAGTAVGHDERSKARADPSRRVEAGAIERGIERLERAVARLEARLAGRGGSMMEGCADMMGGGGMMDGGGMMGGSQPNSRWRSTPQR